jgi:hypothetical protein
MNRIMPLKNKDSLDVSQEACRKASGDWIGSADLGALASRRRVRGEAFPHPLAAGTAALPGGQPTSGGTLIVC